jgi:hypothetical protein
MIIGIALPKCLVRLDFMGRESGAAEVDHARSVPKFVPNTHEVRLPKSALSWPPPPCPDGLVHDGDAYVDAGTEQDMRP